MAAAAQFDVPALREILGSEGEDIIASEDTVLDRMNVVAFAEEARTHLRLERDSTGTVVTLNVGDDDWPLPIPLVADGDQWRFDAAAGPRRDPAPPRGPQRARRHRAVPRLRRGAAAVRAREA